MTIAKRHFFRAESQIVLEQLSPHAISGDGLFAVHERIRDVEEHGKSCLAENLEAIASINAERPSELVIDECEGNGIEVC